MADRIDTRAVTPGVTVVPASAVPEQRGVFAFLSNIEREGRWILPRRFRALAVLGGVELDLTAVEFEAYTEIEIRCFFGNVEVKVPPGVRLEVEGDATIGNFEVHRNTPSTESPDAPLVRIKAGVMFGNIEVTVVDPNATTMLQRLKARWKLRDTNPT
ncbi:MAG: LiaF domain-containing protein [Gemmatimonas sp.]